MHRFARIGGREGVPQFRREVERHATFLRLAPRFGEPVGVDESIWTPAGLEHPALVPGILRAGEAVTASSGFPDDPVAGEPGNRVEVRLEPGRGIVRIDVPLAAVEPFFWTADSRGLVVGNDLRFMIRWAGEDPDPRGLGALRLYGAVPAPFTLSRRVRRVPPGHALELAATPPWGRELSLKAGTGPLPGARSEATFDRFLSEIDAGLMRRPGRLQLLFSGGVDSGLIATRLVRIGRRDASLVNFSFGAEDPESALAERMAARIGLPLRRVPFDLNRLEGLLGRLGQLYSFPFCDLSLIPTALLVEGALEQGPPDHVVDGTGADGAFGIGIRHETWARWYRYPRWVRGLLGAAYARGKWWRRDSSSRLERIGRVARRSAAMPLIHAGVLATNSLWGVAYDSDPAVESQLTESLDRYLGALAGEQDPATALSLADLVHVCAGIYAAKSFDPLRGRGVEPVYPYLEPGALGQALALPWARKCPGGEPKGILKEALVREVPRDLVYRPKSGFLPPFQAILAHPAMQEFLRSELLSGRSPYEGGWRREVVRAMLDRGARGESLCQGAWNLLWTLAFASAWTRQVRIPSPA